MRERERDFRYRRSGLVAMKVFLALMLVPALVAWDLPFLSQRVRGDNDFRSGNFERAIGHYERVIESGTGDWELSYNLGTAYYKTGKWQEAVDELSRAVEIADDGGASETDLAHIHHNLGLAYLQLDDCENAIPELTRAAELAPDDKDIARNMEFAGEYCEGQGCESSQTEGEEQDQGESDEEEDDQGQCEGDSNDETESEEQSETDESGEQQESGESDEQEDENESGKDEQGDESDQTEEQDETGQGEESDESGEEEKEDSGGGEGNVEERGPADIPDDGLPYSDAQIEEILERMSRLEHERAPRYFQSELGEGDYLDNESMMDLLRRLFLGLPTDERFETPEDGIDW